MPDRLSANHWRERATKARALAREIDDPIARRAVLGIAENYEQLAEQAERLWIVAPEEAVTGTSDR
jgi:hypothetical protein